MMGSGMSSHEWRGPHILQEKIEALEKENAALKDQARILSAAVDRAEKAQDILQDQVKLLRGVLAEVCGYWIPDHGLIEYEKQLMREAINALAATEPKE